MARLFWKKRKQNQESSVFEEYGEQKPADFDRQVIRIYRRLSSNNVMVRLSAESELRNLGTQAVKRLMHLMKSGALVTYAEAVEMFLVPFLGIAFFSWVFSLPPFLIITLALLWLIYKFWLRNTRKVDSEKLVTVAGVFKDQNSLDLLFLLAEHNQLQPKGEELMAEILKQPDTNFTLTDEQVDILLNKLLEKNLELRIAILHTLERNGIRKALPAVRSLAGSEKQDWRIQMEAQRVLRSLEELEASQSV